MPSVFNAEIIGWYDQVEVSESQTKVYYGSCNWPFIERFKNHKVFIQKRKYSDETKFFHVWSLSD